jgi:uncharacterized protein with GYD domain
LKLIRSKVFDDKEEDSMPNYMIQAAYTPEALQALMKNPQSRSEVIRAAVEGMGGKFIGGWASFGDYDTVMIVDLPSTVDAAAIALAASAGGSCKAIKTTVLLTTEEALQAIKKAPSTGYKPVAASAAGR